MRIVILGAGRVGESVAESLVSERNDITIIDPDPQRLRWLEERLDLRGIAGDGIQPSILEAAGMADADMLIACATRDETNLAVCKIAHDRFNVPTTIARLRSSEFAEGDPLLSRDGFAVDHVICPEESIGDGRRVEQNFDRRLATLAVFGAYQPLGNDGAQVGRQEIGRAHV